MERFRFGLSGLSGPRTQSMLYGADAPSLAGYAKRFDAYEVGASQFEQWTRRLSEELVDRMPPHVALVARMSRTISQAATIAGHENELGRWLDATAPLLRASNRGPLYMPWTGAWTPAAQQQLQDTLEALWPSLPSSQRIAVEFRHGTWLQPSVVHMLEEYGAGLVWSTLAGRVPYRVTADFVYARLTGHHSRRVSDEVHALASQIEARPSDNRPAYVISSRHHDPYGLHALDRFAERVGAPTPCAAQLAANPGQPSLRAFAVS